MGDELFRGGGKARIFVYIYIIIIERRDAHENAMFYPPIKTLDQSISLGK